jgi:transposase
VDLHHGDSATFVPDASRAKRVVKEFLDGFRPEYWVSDRYGDQQGWAGTAHQFCLTHLIRGARYAEESGDNVLATKIIHLLIRARRVRRRRDDLSDSTLKVYPWRLEDGARRGAGARPRARRGCEAPERGDEGSAAPVRLHDEPRHFPDEQRVGAVVAAVFRKVTNGLRTEWGVKFYADFRSVVENARRRCIGAIEAIRLTLAGKPLSIPA